MRVPMQQGHRSFGQGGYIPTPQVQYRLTAQCHDFLWKCSCTPLQPDGYAFAESDLPALAGPPGLYPSKLGMCAPGKAPILTVQSGETPQSVCYLGYSQRAGGITRIGPTLHDVFHDEQEIQPQVVDYRFVDQRMVHIQGHTRLEETALVEKVAVAQVDDAVRWRVRLEKNVFRSDARLVGQSKAR